MKKNNKGFTLIELLATIVILGLLAAITITSLTGYYQKSKEKANEAFKEQLVDYVNDYIALYGGTLFDNTAISSTKYKCYNDPGRNNKKTCTQVILKEASKKPTIESIATNFTNKDIKNPSTKVECTNDNLTITIYRDSDYVYCQKLEPNNSSSCIDETIDTCDDIFKSTDETEN